ncbi:Histone-lysine N-methyltransferase [Phytophthora cinnamomi]|uniref:Histone-lysine N-methyltransferase n=1 Tax=Phytophthora cinnamomi TaxID=4785 RepID=UPI00355ABA02|nr:Histone-lysine N-methyltransferase [Phytophthora cinnamomi]
MSGHATEDYTAPTALHATSTRSVSSYTPTVASWSTQSGQPSDCTRRLSSETTRSVISSISSDSSDDEEADKHGYNSDSSERTWTQSPPGSQGEKSDQNLPDEWRPASWPIFVTPITRNDNPREYRFESVVVGKPCGCSSLCSALSCENALNNRCCVEDNCSFSAKCGNTLKQNPDLVLSMRKTSTDFGVTAAGLIASGEVIDEYCGYVMEMGDLESRAAVENGYRMLLDTPSIDGKSIGIDALWCGNIMRFVNHHCNPNCRFQEVRVGQRVAVVVVTLRAVLPGEEVTVSKSGYRNYSREEVLLLSLIVQQLKPLGKNQWERVKEAYDMRRPRSWPDRDYDSLKRKFKEAAATPKPTGKASVPIHIAAAKLAQKHIDEDTSANTMDDGKDDGQDDAELLKHVAEMARAKCDSIMKDLRVNSRAHSEGFSSGAESEEDEVDERSPVKKRDHERGDAPLPLTEMNGSQRTSMSPPARPVGVIIGRDGLVIDAALAAELELSDIHIPGDSDEEKAEGPAGSEPAAAKEPLQSQSAEALQTPNRKSTGRPKKKASEPRPTVTSPSRTPLNRNPARAVSDATEQKANPKKSAVSARLGGQDLRVIRDNISQLTKRSSSEASAPADDTSYAKNKRIRTARKLSDLEKSLNAVEKQESSGRSDIMEMMIMFRQEAEMKAQAEEVRRREDRETREAADRRDRDERERIRRDEFAHAEAQRKLEREEARLEREERILLEQRRAEERELDRAESRRRHEERLQLEREEAKNRHEQMLLLFASMKK